MAKKIGTEEIYNHLLNIYRNRILSSNKQENA